MKENNESTRRSFLRSLSVGACLAAGLPDVFAAATDKSSSPKITLQKDDTVLFQGDSITYWYRKLDAMGSNDSQAMGSGYALLTASELLNRHAEKNLKFFNKGISGNIVKDLEARWDADCLSLKPNVLSILIGVNDFSLKMREKKGSAGEYREAYQRLLDRTMSALPNVKLIIAEPFAINGLIHVNDTWFPGFDEYRQVAKETAEKYKAAFIPLHGIFQKALRAVPNPYWSGDGIHPSMAGAGLMSKAWLEVFR
jgi:lysophospholipase L1-like esterase